MLRGQAEQPFGRGLDFLLSDPRSENRSSHADKRVALMGEENRAVLRPELYFP
jgi:hypothetical protein